MSSDPFSSDAHSQILAISLMLAVLFLLAAIVLAMLLMLPSLALGEDKIPTVFIITAITHDDEKTGAHNFDSRIIMMNSGTKTYQNGDLTAKFYKNGEPVQCTIQTLHGEDFIPTHHFGIQTISGTGCRGETWLPAEKIAFDFNDKTFYPGDEITAEIFSITTNQIISRDTYIA